MVFRSIARAAQSVPSAQKVLYSSGQVSINVLSQAFNTVAVYYYVAVLHVPGAWISVAMVLLGMLNALMNLFVGHVSDRTHSPWGRRIPHAVFGGIPFVVAFFFLFHPPSLGLGAMTGYFFILTLLFDLGLTVTALNLNALYPEMYSAPRDRAHVAALQQLFGVVGLLIGVASSKALGQTLGWSNMALLLAIVAIFPLYGALLGAFEHPASSEEALLLGKAVSATFRNRRFVVYVVASLFIQLVTTMLVTLSSFYTKYVVVLTSTQNSLFLGILLLMAVPVSFVWARVSTRWTTVRAAILAVFVYMGFTALFWVDTTPVMVIVTGALLGIPVAGFMVTLNILLADVIDFDARQTGLRREGMYMGINGLMVRLGMSLQYAILGVFFAVSGYNAHLTIQSPGTIRDFRILMAVIPSALLIGAAFLLSRYATYLRAARQD